MWTDEAVEAPPFSESDGELRSRRRLTPIAARHCPHSSSKQEDGEEEEEECGALIGVHH